MPLPSQNPSMIRNIKSIIQSSVLKYDFKNYRNIYTLNILKKNRIIYNNKLNSSTKINTIEIRNFTTRKVVSQNTLKPIEGSKHNKKRLGRGRSSGVGKTCKRGQKGTHSRSGQFGKVRYEGGQTMLWRRTPKFGFPRRIPRCRYTTITFERILEYIRLGKLDTTITMKDLIASRITHNIKYGIKIVGSNFITAATAIPKLNIQVTHASDSVKKQIEKNGGHIEFVYFNRLSLQRIQKCVINEREDNPWKKHLIYPCIQSLKKVQVIPPQPNTPPPRLRLRYETQSTGKTGWIKQREILQSSYVRKFRNSYKNL